MQLVQLSATRCSYITILSVSLVSFTAITLCVPSQRVLLMLLLSTQSGNFWIHPRTPEDLDTPAKYRQNDYVAVPGSAACSRLSPCCAGVQRFSSPRNIRPRRRSWPPSIGHSEPTGKSRVEAAPATQRHALH